jgi:hypothetical protein
MENRVSLKEELVNKLLPHWDEKSRVKPNDFKYNDLKHISDIINEKKGDNTNYLITDVRLTNMKTSVEFKICINGKKIDCPAYFFVATITLT